MELPHNVAAFWRAYCQTRSDATTPALTADPLWQFGDTPDEATRIGNEVCQGKKMASSALLWEMEANDVPLPAAGELAVVLDGLEQPLCVVEITDVAVQPFHQIAAEFALAEGEPSLEAWRETNWAYFAEVCRELGREPVDTMPLVCQRFRRVYPAAEQHLDSVYTRKHRRLLWYAGICNLVSWFFAGMLMLRAVISILQLIQYIQMQGGMEVLTENLLAVLKESIASAHFLVSGAVAWLSLRGVALGLNILVETDMNFRMAKGAVDHGK